MMMMMDVNLAPTRAHRNNIARYRRLLQTQLTDLEREFIETRISEELQALAEFSGRASPFARQPSSSAASDDPLLSPETWNWFGGELQRPDRSAAA
jgi:hypothetical protein